MTSKSLLKTLVSSSFCLPILVWASNSSAPAAVVRSSSVCVDNQATTSNSYTATKWYRDSAEKNAQYKQIFRLGLEKISAKVKQQKLKKNTWGVILDIDETVLDNSLFAKRSVLNCSAYDQQANYVFMEEKVSTATPGAKDLTCSVQKLGGKVVLVTNRDGTYDDQIQPATIDNLKNAGICFDSVVFAKGTHDTNKTPRFNAVATGNYAQLIASNKLPAFKVIAYFGDNIQDFPNISQAEAIQEDPNGSYYQKFGEEYFSLPNPTYGSWEHNSFN